MPLQELQGAERGDPRGQAQEPSLPEGRGGVGAQSACRVRAPLQTAFQNLLSVMATQHRPPAPPSAVDSVAGTGRDSAGQPPRLAAIGSEGLDVTLKATVSPAPQAVSQPLSLYVGNN